MKITLSTEQAADQLFKDEHGGWTREGARAVVESLEIMEDETGTELELDPVAIRGDFNEFGCAQHAVKEMFGPDTEHEIYEHCENEREQELAALRCLEENDTFVNTTSTGGVITRNE